MLFLLLKRREKQDFHGYGIPSYFSFPKLSFIEYHTIISEVCFNNRELHSSILGVIFGVILCFLGVISLALSIILCLLGVILNFLFTFFVSVYFSVYFIELSTFSVYIFAIKSTIFIIQRIIFIVQGFTLGFILGFNQSFGVHIIVLPFYSINNGKCEIISLYSWDYVKRRLFFVPKM